MNTRNFNQIKDLTTKPVAVAGGKGWTMSILFCRHYAEAVGLDAEVRDLG